MSDKTETQEESHNGLKFFGALITGALIGAGIGFLMASDENKNLREKIKEELKDFAGDIKDKVGEKISKHCPGCKCNEEHKNTETV